MKKYGLFSKIGEKIKSISANSKSEAIEFFSVIKNLEKDKMIDIFDVEVISSTNRHPHLHDHEDH